MNSILRMSAIFKKEVKQLYRDKITIGSTFLLAIFQLILYGYAIHTHIRHLPIAVVDQSLSTQSRHIQQTIQATNVVKITHQYATIYQAKEAIRVGKIRAALFIPANLDERLETQQSLGQWLVDGSDSVTSSTIKQLEHIPSADLSSRFSSKKSLPSTFIVTALYNPDERSVVNVIPGLAGLILTTTMVVLTSISIVRERELGNLELLIATPIKPIELMLAKVLPYLFVGLGQVLLILGLGYLWFDVPINGSIIDIFGLTLLITSASVTFGLFISTLVKTQLQALQLSVSVMLPAILLSGFFFSYDAMPVAAQWFADAMPITHFIHMVRGIVLREASLIDMWQDALWLLSFTIIGLWLTATRFKKSLD
ncbi:MAG: ABC transporter permease [Parashewanella sp.]